MTELECHADEGHAEHRSERARTARRPMHLLVTALTSTAGRIDQAAGGQDDTYGFALTAHPGKSQGRPPTNTAPRAIE